MTLAYSDRPTGDGLAFLTRHVYHWAMQAMAFRDDPSAPGERVWQRGRFWSAIVAICALLLVMLALGMFALAIALILSGSLTSAVIGVVTLAIAVPLGQMAYLTCRLVSGVGPAEIGLGGDAVRLKLPGWRSLIHRPAGFTGTIPYADIVAVETRLESYSGQIERTSRLCLRDGGYVFLFDEGYAGTRQWSRSFQPLVEGIAEAAGVPLRDLGMAEGRARPLMAWMAKPLAWDAEAVSPARERILWGHARIIGMLIMLSLALMMIAKAIGS